MFQALDDLAELPVFGSGTFGIGLAHLLDRAGVQVPFVTDRSQNRPTPFPFVALEEVSGPMDIALGVHNPNADVFRITSELQSRGIRVWTPPQIAAWLASRKQIFLSNYWLDPTVDFDDYASEINAARSLLADQASIDCFDRVIEYRRFGRAEDSTPESAISDHYMPVDVPFITTGMRFADVGAFKGDTVAALMSRCGSSIDAMFCLEPDSVNYEDLKQELQSRVGLAWSAAPLAAWNETRALSFSAEGSGSSSVSTSGNGVVQAVLLDDLLGSWNPTHIKMDIEGSEPMALSVAKAVLRSRRPRLAISSYHRPTHHWDLINQISEMDLNYQFFVRNNGFQTFEVVIYAIPL